MSGMKNSRRKVSSCNTFPLSNDILENNILPRLPVKSIFRFRCVCKRWGSLLTADSIFSLQKPLSLKPPSGLAYWNEKRLSFLSTDGRPMSVPDPKLSFLGEFVSVTNSCNGLICGFYVREGIWPEIYVCNPVTKQVRSTRTPKRGLIVGLAFDPSSPDPHYKLMCPFKVYKNTSHIEYGFNLFVSSTGMWRESKERIRISPESAVTGRSFFVDGVLYFKATNDIIWFQIDNDLAGVEPLPLSNNMITATLGEYNSKLSYIQITLDEIEIWTLKNFLWKKKHCVGLDLLDLITVPDKVSGHCPLLLMMSSCFRWGQRLTFTT
ncbi:hypothetical protein AQUCO_07400058v1 [Aquilegia coerulea]|uniref:Uncharacterized protein n=1 Tax=Aquilegia coerulea TaxID=218851 RepID=A0A2G5C9I0_AQUCA|nr:hypothetical protein AQUCO_07400058v1 [Aquilegia coerulea]